MSLDMADRMVVMGISANSMVARAVADRKNTFSLESSLKPGEQSKAKASLPVPPHTVPVALVWKH